MRATLVVSISLDLETYEMLQKLVYWKKTWRSQLIRDLIRAEYRRMLEKRAGND